MIPISDDDDDFVEYHAHLFKGFISCICSFLKVLRILKQAALSQGAANVLQYRDIKWVVGGAGF